MMTYIHALESSSLPVGHWGLGAVWCVLYTIARFGASRSNALVASHPQSFISYGGPPMPIEEQSFRLRRRWKGQDNCLPLLPHL